MGWKVQADDGTYLTSQWYQSTDGKWYFLGADGYMMVNIVTPDGYYVNAEGVWVEQQPEPDPSTYQTIGGGSIQQGTLSSEQNLTSEQIDAINNSSWN